MKIIAFLLLLVGLKEAHGQKLSLNISSSDTVEYGEPIRIKVSIRNQSKKPVLLFKDFTFTSNLYPNPIEMVNQGASLHFIIEPIPDFSATWVEGQTVITDNKYKELLPGKHYDTEYNLGKHLNEFISDTDKEKWTDKAYRIKVKYLNSKGHKSVRGEYDSNEIVVFVKK
ncbi:hypothetical protein GU926_05030 [Nibribacter ruber]|uniref:Intracellular proteinase inhibitor BsuPI domain-containing protein n=1 Tax=Nibribacter ruber TaxID=2698458 RepID=A0A6P1NWZ6_9BACT|nr:hypothetical protein [Nibribacter ruber]QHL86834.1 hypothetical protein GU926_05030 [Nibribacter ruber]